MNNSIGWQIVEPDVPTAMELCGRPLERLAQGDVPAIVLRNAIEADACDALVQRLIAEDYLFDANLPIPQKFVEAAIPEGYFRDGKDKQEKYAWQSGISTGSLRIDVGTSLGYRGSDPAAFFAHSAETHQLFSKLFDAEFDPIRLCYDRLEQLSLDKRVMTAREPDGRQYGPAIIRAHYGGYTYRPHFDSVRLRENRSEYAVYEFEHQFAGVLVLQNTHLGDQSAQCVLHRSLWTPELDPILASGKFHEYAKDQGVENVEVVLDPGDLYFFNTRAIHEVPGVAGDSPRIVLAMFIGFSSDRDEIFVWS